MKQIIFTVVAYSLVVCLFCILSDVHIHPCNKTWRDPVKMLLPFCKERPNTYLARCILFVLYVVLALQIFWV